MLHVSAQGGPYRDVPLRVVKKRVAVMMRALALTSHEVSVLLTGDAEIQALNKAYRGKDKPTDVLSFAQREGEFGDLGDPLLGDIVVSVPRAREQAKQASHSALAETTMLLAHGLLHLLGWDHDTLAKDKRMRAEVARLVRASEREDPVRTKPQKTRVKSKKFARVR